MSKNNDAFKIYVDQLNNGHVETLKEIFTTDFLDVNESDLKFTGNVKMTGEAYVATDNLIIHFSAVAQAELPCSMCNQPVTVEIAITNGYHIESLDSIKSGIFCFENILREAILLETPAFAECNNGHCPSRNEVKKFLKIPGENSPNDEGQQPFAHLSKNIDL